MTPAPMISTTATAAATMICIWVENFLPPLPPGCGAPNCGCIGWVG
ncbi:hypothetical protein SBADM41S_09461 [Streptomyces badius]